MIADDDVRIAYQDFGTGPATVFAQHVFGHLEGYWEFDSMRRLFERMASNLRVLMFDHRGSGMSDGFVESPSLDDRLLDVKAVMDHAEVDQASLIGFDVGGQVAVGFAAEYPARVDRLVLTNTRVGTSAEQRAGKLYPGAEHPGPPPGAGAFDDLDLIGIDVAESIEYFSPSVSKNPDELRSAPSFQARIGSRDVHKRQAESLSQLDILEVAPLVHAPTLITHTRGNRLIHVGYARLLAELIPDSTLTEFEGDDQFLWVADNWREIIDAHIAFITQSDIDVPVDRRFAVVLFTDMVGSTVSSVASGDNQWRHQLDIHDRITARVVSQHDGTIVKNTGDGILALFDTPSQGVAAALQLREDLNASDIPIRAGIHAGEVEIRGEDISGAVVNLTARVEQAAADGNIYVTSTIKDMLLGSAHNFESVGSHKLKGFDGDWPLFKVVHH